MDVINHRFPLQIIIRGPILKSIEIGCRKYLFDCQLSIEIIDSISNFRSIVFSNIYRILMNPINFIRQCFRSSKKVIFFSMKFEIFILFHDTIIYIIIKIKKCNLIGVARSLVPKYCC